MKLTQKNGQNLKERVEQTSSDRIQKRTVKERLKCQRKGKTNFVKLRNGGTFLFCNNMTLPIPVAACSKSWVCGRIPPGACLSAFCERFVLSGRDLCVGLITRPEESYRA
jgi:hypothetical protein